MSQEYNKPVREKSTIKVTCAWKNAAGTAVTPDSATWTLTDEGGDTINSRSEISIAAPSTTNDVVLSGDDLALQSTTENGKRFFMAEAIYDSDEGNDLPLKDQLTFYVKDLLNVT